MTFDVAFNYESSSNDSGTSKQYICLLFGVQDGNNFYSANIGSGSIIDTEGDPQQDAHGASLSIDKVSDGSISNLASNSDAEMRQGMIGEWTSVTLEWRPDGTINISWERSDGTAVKSISAVDNEFKGGGIGFRRRESEGYAQSDFYLHMDDVKMVDNL